MFMMEPMPTRERSKQEILSELGKASRLRRLSLGWCPVSRTRRGGRRSNQRSAVTTVRRASAVGKSLGGRYASRAASLRPATKGGPGRGRRVGRVVCDRGTSNAVTSRKSVVNLISRTPRSTREPGRRRGLTHALTAKSSRTPAFAAPASAIVATAERDVPRHQRLPSPVNTGGDSIPCGPVESRPLGGAARVREAGQRSAQSSPSTLVSVRAHQRRCAVASCAA